MQLLDGKKVREARTPLLMEKIAALSFTPCLVIIQVGNREDSTAFISAKRAFAKKLGVKEIHVQLEEKATQDEVVKTIQKYNTDTDVHGIIIQLPLPIHMDPDAVIDKIDVCKDVDGLTSHNVKRWMNGRADGVTPATTRGIKELLDFYKIDLFGKKVVMIGRSSLVGKPTAFMCLNQNATVTICHSKTSGLEKETQKADVVIVAIGKPGFIGKKYLSKGQVVIDIGITRLPDGRLSGDVNFEEAKDLVEMITPVPGGVGQMTVLALFENLVEMC